MRQSYKFWVSLLTGLMLVSLLPVVEAAYNFTDPAFGSTWNRADKAVQELTGVGRGYTWGPPAPGAEGIQTEQYNGAPRKVQYFDKARMEINNPSANPNDLYFVTTGLLVKELVTGQRQDSDTTFTALPPSPVQIAGDSNEGGNNAIAPTYASFQNVVTFLNNQNTRPAAPNSLITARIDKSGQVTTFSPPERRFNTGYDPVTQHNISDVFVTFGQQRGSVWNGSGYVQDSVLFNNPTYVLGRPVTEAYWIRAVVAGVERDILVQLFERRVLTYTPANPDPYKVEMGNVGQHYFRWRYALNGCNVPPAQAATATGPARPVSFGGKGKVQDQTIFSQSINKSLPYRVYLPRDYETSGKRYPVLYMLHGYGGNYVEWDAYGLLGIADDLMGGAQIQPFIIVLPSGEQSYWVNQANCGPRWADYVSQDLVKFMDATYRTLPRFDKRAIGGLSMGGHGSLQIAFNHPEVFKIIGAHSPTLRTEGSGPSFFGNIAYYATLDPISLARTKDLSSYFIWLDIGMDDSAWRPRAEELHQVLLDRGKAHTWKLFEGGHLSQYWASHIIDYLQYYNAAFGS